jgi:hypothetical protein
MKKIILASVSAIALLGLAACNDNGGTDNQTTQSTTPPATTTSPATPPADNATPAPAPSDNSGSTTGGATGSGTGGTTAPAQ